MNYFKLKVAAWLMIVSLVIMLVNLISFVDISSMQLVNLSFVKVFCCTLVSTAILGNCILLSVSFAMNQFYTYKKIAAFAGMLTSLMVLAYCILTIHAIELVSTGAI